MIITICLKNSPFLFLFISVNPAYIFVRRIKGGGKKVTVKTIQTMVSCHAWNPVADIRHHQVKPFCHSTLPPLLALVFKEMLQLFIWFGT